MPPVNTGPKGRITGLLALTVYSDEALADGDAVQVVSDYKVAKADADVTTPVVGIVSKNAVRRSGGSYPVADANQPVTVEARGFMVVTMVAGGTITAGQQVGANASKAVVAGGTAVIGTALTGATVGLAVDVLVQ